jgi:hypothetical protein
MQDDASQQPFRLSTGGLFYSLGLRTHLLKEGEYRTRLVIAVLVTLSWLPLIVLSALTGTLTDSGTTVGLVSDWQPHVRCLFAIPALVIAAIIIDPIIGGALNGFRESGILPDEQRPKLEQALDELSRRRDAFLPDFVMLAIVALLAWSYVSGFADIGIENEPMSWMVAKADSDSPLTLAGWWSLLVSAPVLQILLYRWLWRFVIWAGFLYHFSRIKLTLEPSHPDLAAGLGPLKYTQGAFTIVFVALSAMVSVSLANEIMLTDLTLLQMRPFIIGFIVACIALTSLPLLFFAPKLVEAKRRGRRAYGVLGHKLTRAFDERWTDKDEASVGEDLLHAIDPSAMADYTAVYENVKGMHIIPVSLRSYALQAALLALPFLPLIFIEISFPEVMSRLLDSLV